MQPNSLVVTWSTVNETNEPSVLLGRFSDKQTKQENDPTMDLIRLRCPCLFSTDIDFFSVFFSLIYLYRN